MEASLRWVLGHSDRARAVSAALTMTLPAHSDLFMKLRLLFSIRISEIQFLLLIAAQALPL